MDYVTITGLQIFAHHGVYEEEKLSGQDFFVNAKLYYDMDRAAQSDAVEDAVHYGEVCELLHEFLTQHTFHLLEKAVSEAAKAVLLAFPLLRGIEMELCKPQAPIQLPFENVSVTRSLFWHTVYLSAGSNMGEKENYLNQAVQALSQDSDFKDVRTSGWIETKPYGGVEQDDFLNGAIAVQTLLSPERLLARLHGIEAAAGRERLVHWGPRTLDLDILFYDDLVLDTEQLTIPHADLQNRSFVLTPMLALAPSYRHPVLNRTIRQLHEALSNAADT